MWWTKSRRAQNVDDYETWISGGVVPTLNVFDNASDTRATVLILFEPKSLFEENWAEAKVKNALRANASKSSHLIIDGTRVDDVRVYEDGIVPTVVARYGTGGGNVPMVFPIQDGREMEKNQNGLGIGDENAPAYTLDTTGGQAVAIPIQGTVIGRADTSGPQGKGFSDDGSPMFTLTKTDIHAISTVAFGLDDQQNGKEELMGTLTSRGNSGGRQEAVAYKSIVRRLTPIECERLQGFPDDWTSGQADSNRYKQMGNAVAVPVVEWIVGRLVAQLNE